MLQATQHTDDWRETGQDLLRVLKPGGPIVVTEITLSPKLKMKAELDIHIEAWIEKIFSRIGWSFDQTPYYSLADLLAAFQGLVDSREHSSGAGSSCSWRTTRQVDPELADPKSADFATDALQ